jgi:hypothetical protein
MAILRPTDVCPRCLARDELFEGFETGDPDDLVGWGCFRCEFFYLPNEFTHEEHAVAEARYKAHNMVLLRKWMLRFQRRRQRAELRRVK